MRAMRKDGRRQRGVALVLAIFTLMLISVVGTALILMAGTETAIKTNYKSAMHAFYDAKAGLEEGRGRLWAGNPNSISNCVFPVPGTPMPVGNVCYIINPSAGEIVNPLDLSAGNPYADNEYVVEFGTPVTGANVQQPFINSTSPVGAIAGPLYKWVRITPTTENSTGLDVNGDGRLDPTNTALFYDGRQQVIGQPPGGGGGQVLSITALSVTPYGSRRVVQYRVWSPLAQLALNFPAAVVVPGGTAVYQPPTDNNVSNNFFMNGNDRSGANPGVCALPPQTVAAIGVTGDPSPVINDIPNNRKNRYPGVGGATPSVSDVGSALPMSEQTVSGLDALATAVTNAATDVVFPPSGTATSLPNLGSPTNPVIEVVQGNLTITPGSMTTGYGILLVTGTLQIGGGFGWRGIILVIGSGQINGDAQTSNEFDGAILVANTRDGSGNLLPTLGSANVGWANATGGNGVFYDSCWINNAALASSYQILAFREIPQQTP